MKSSSEINDLPLEIVDIILDNMELKDLCNSIKLVESFKDCFLNNLDKYLEKYDMLTYDFNKNQNNLVDHFINIAMNHWEFIYIN